MTDLRWALYCIVTAMVVVFIGLILCLAIAHANPWEKRFLTQPHWSDGVVIPDPSFDHEPHQAAIILYQYEFNIDFAHNPEHPRKGLQKGWITEAFTIINSDEFEGHCLIVMPIPGTIPKSEADHVYRHERAHCNGWDHFGE